MDKKSIALWVLGMAYLGAIAQVPSIFLDEVLGMSVVFAGLTLVVCAIVNARRKKA